MEEKTYQAVHPLDHDGKTVAAGGSVALDQDTAKELLALGAVIPVEDEESAKEESTGYDAAGIIEDAKIVNAIREVIPTLQPDDFKTTGDKGPKVGPVEEALKETYSAKQITGELVALAWKKHQETQGQAKGD